MEALFWQIKLPCVVLLRTCVGAVLFSSCSPPETVFPAIEAPVLARQCQDRLREPDPHRRITRGSCYTHSVLKNVTITVEDEDLKWVRRRAAEKETSVSRLVGQMIRRERLHSDSYRAAYESWKKMKPWPADASKRMTREKTHERR